MKPLPRWDNGRDTVLAGDAAGVVAPASGEGIYYAMVSGDRAARTIISTPAHAIAKLARRYHGAVRREIGAELRDSVLIQRFLFADGRRIADVINGASQEPEITRLVLDVAVGRLSYSSLRWRMLARVPRLAAHLVWGRLKTKFSSGTADVARV